MYLIILLYIRNYVHIFNIFDHIYLCMIIYVLKLIKPIIILTYKAVQIRLSYILFVYLPFYFCVSLSICFLFYFYSSFDFSLYFYFSVYFYFNPTIYIYFYLILMVCLYLLF